MKIKIFIRDYELVVVPVVAYNLFCYVCILICNGENREISSIDRYHKMTFFLPFKNKKHVILNIEDKSLIPIV